MSETRKDADLLFAEAYFFGKKVTFPMDFIILSQPVAKTGVP